MTVIRSDSCTLPFELGFIEPHLADVYDSTLTGNPRHQLLI
jgi:hypothetical protein